MKLTNFTARTGRWSRALAFAGHAFTLLAIIAYPLPLAAQACDPGGPTYYLQDDSGGQGVVSLEAELYTQTLRAREYATSENVYWHRYADVNASNGAAVVIPTVNKDAFDPNDYGAELSYDITFQRTGAYYMWIRYIALDNDARSFHLLLDGVVILDDIEVPYGQSSWQWTKMGFTIPVPSTGVHRLTIRHREDGLRLDKLVLSKSSTYNPTGIGPDATAVRTYAATDPGRAGITYHVDRHTGHGFAVVEAEHPTSRMYGIGNLACLEWTPAGYAAGSNDSISRVNTTGRVATANTVWGSPRLEFAINTDRSEPLYLYLRHRGVAGNSSVYYKVNNGTTRSFNLADVTEFTWEAVSLGTVAPRSDGTLLLSLLMQEDGTIIDKLMLTTDPNYNPTGKGPLETIYNTSGLVYQQQDTEGYPVELPLEAPSQNLGGFYSFSGMQWRSAQDVDAQGGSFATVDDPLTGWTQASGDLTRQAPTMEFEIDFIQGGPHYVFTRHRSPNDLRNSYAYYLDGVKIGEHEVPASPGAWTYASSAPQIDIPGPGRHTFGFAMMESGTAFDHVVISQQPTGSALVLPIELEAFTGRATGATNLLEWTTVREENTRMHHIERSLDGGKHWISLGSISAAGASDRRISYRFVDQAPAPLGYYRLVTEDLDGSVNSSSVISVERAPGNLQLSIFPNPASEFAVLTFDHAGRETVTLSIATLTGQAVAVRDYAAVDGENTVDIPLTHLAAGNYLLSGVIGGRLYTRQLAVVR